MWKLGICGGWNLSFGAAIVVIGFYAVIWGKTQEKVEEDCTVYNSESYNDEVPLLQNKKMGE